MRVKCKECGYRKTSREHICLNCGKRPSKSEINRNSMVKGLLS